MSAVGLLAWEFVAPGQVRKKAAHYEFFSAEGLARNFIFWSFRKKVLPILWWVFFYLQITYKFMDKKIPCKISKGKLKEHKPNI